MTDTGVHFERYMFPTATLFPSGTVGWSEMALVNLGSNPLEVWLHSGEVLFLSIASAQELEQHATSTGVPVKKSRQSNWRSLLSPSEAGYAALKQTGLSPSEMIRARFRGEFTFKRCRLPGISEERGFYDLLFARMWFGVLLTRVLNVPVWFLRVWAFRHRGFYRWATLIETSGALDDNAGAAEPINATAAAVPGSDLSV